MAEEIKSSWAVCSVCGKEFEIVGNGYREYSVGCYIKVFDEDEEKHWLDRQYGYLEWDRYSNGHGGCSLYKVTAWMPLPKLYKG